MMMDDREDGELSGSGTEDMGVTSASAEVPAKAAAELPQFQFNHSQFRGGSRGMGARTALGSSDEDQSSDDDSDDENCHLKAPAKRPRKMPFKPSQSVEPAFAAQPTSQQTEQKPSQPAVPTQNSGPAVKPKKRNNIWSNVMGEQLLTEDIGGVGLKKLEGDRNVENYDFKAAQAALLRAREMEEEQQQMEGADEDDLEEGEMKEDQHKEINEEGRKQMAKRLSRKRPLNHRVYRPPSSFVPPADPGEPLLLPIVAPDQDSTDQQVADEIAEGLMEQKPEIIARVVEVMGRELALKLYADTRDTEQKGGMMILNGGRRRTSGGVFLQLLKQVQLNKEQQAAIFPPDEAQKQWHRRRRAVHRRRNRERHDTQGTDNSQASDGQQQARSGSERSSGSPRLPPADGDDSCDVPDLLAGSQCPGSTPVTSPAPSPGPTPATTPVVTPHCSDVEDDRGIDSRKLVDTALAIVKAVTPPIAPLAQYDEDFLDMSGGPPADEMDVI